MYYNTFLSEVPEGSVLGPLLFSLYINDISSEILSCKYHICAEDLQLHVSARPEIIRIATSIMNKNLLVISKWAKNLDFKLNPCSSQVILLTHPKLVNHNFRKQLPPILLNDKQLPYEKSTQKPWRNL